MESEIAMPKVMVVDDDEEFTALYTQYLMMVGIDAVAENHSARAIERAYSIKPDVFVLDLMMPAPDGFQLCRMIRADPILKHIPIIIVTALTDLDSKLVAMGAGANDYLTKPFHIEDLKSRIQSLAARAKRAEGR
jgi:DNA-binding response OmpR family regulator